MAVPRRRWTMLRSLAFRAPGRSRSKATRPTLLLAVLCFAAGGLLSSLGAQTPEELEAGRNLREAPPAGQTPAPAQPVRTADDPALKRVQAPAEESWARVKSGGASARRYAGEREESFRTLEAGTVVRVRGNYNGWWRVSVPGGLEGWVSTSF